MTTTAIVLAGAGARGAYEAGVLSVLVPRLLAERDDRIILVGTSAGAINTAILAAFETADEAIAEMTKLWSTVDATDVFSGILASSLPTVVSYARHHLAGVLDSRRLGATMEHRLDWDQLDRNLTGAGWVDTAGVVTTSCATGRCVVFLQGRDLRLPEQDQPAGIDYAATMLRSSHVMASAAIPVAFRPVHIDQPSERSGWYLDGGVKLNAPIKPSISLCADRIVVVATTPDPAGPHASPVAEGAPDIFDAGAVVLHAFLVDRMADDIRALRRVNDLLAGHHDPAATGYRIIPNLYLGPPEPGLIGQMANDVFSRGIRRQFSELSVLGRLLGGTPASHGQLLSFMFFDREFHEELIDMGRAHAAATLGPNGSPLPWHLPGGREDTGSISS